jgi:polar amino acid transport system substrate-binding protein
MYILKNYKIFLFIIIPISISYNISAESIDIAFGDNRPPFIYEDKGVYKGLEIDIVNSALKLKNHHIKKISTLPNIRLKSAVLNLNYDAAAGIRKSNPSIYYSDDYITFENFAISKKKNNVVLKNITDLKKYSVTAWQNASEDLGKEYAKIYGHSINYDKDLYMEFNNQSYQNIFFWRSRNEVIIIDKTMFNWHRIELSNKFDTSEKIIFHNIFKTKTSFKVGFKKKNLRDDFNHGLRLLKESGEYKKIRDRYEYAILN